MFKVEVSAERFTKPKRIICRNTLFNGYVQADGSWGKYKTAKRFEDEQRARQYANNLGLRAGEYSILPISKPKAIK